MTKSTNTSKNAATSAAQSATKNNVATTADTQAKKSLFYGWNFAPNLVTYSRILLVVVFLVLDVLAGAWGAKNLPLRWIAAILFIIAASTDKIDGWMARKYNQVTELGKLMDPIADKLLTCGALIVCSIFGELWWWVTILFLIREIGITVMRFFVMEQPGGKVIAAAWPGKLKTVFQCIGLSMLLLPFWSLGSTNPRPVWMSIYYFVTYAIIFIALALCLYSGGIYLYNTFVAPKKAAQTKHGRG